jgi:hypothetical protein
MSEAWPLKVCSFFLNIKQRTKNPILFRIMQEIGLRFLHLSYLELAKELAIDLNSKFRVSLWEIVR